MSNLHSLKGSKAALLTDRLDAPCGLFLGSLYEDKRLDYLIEAADIIVNQKPTFTLVIAGDGPARRLVTSAAATRSHIFYAGRVELEDKAVLLKHASALLLPGAVGLAVVDGFVAGIPTITTAVPRHGPELEYITDGVTGVILPAGAPPAEYAGAVINAIDYGQELRSGAARAGTLYTTGSMVARFVDGITKALATPPLSQANGIRSS
jgi:glycosyltransferase involved in cell wall biosynthesis